MKLKTAADFNYDYKLYDEYLKRLINLIENNSINNENLHIHLPEYDKTVEQLFKFD